MDGKKTCFLVHGATLNMVCTLKKRYITPIKSTTYRLQMEK